MLLLYYSLSDTKQGQTSDRRRLVTFTSRPFHSQENFPDTQRNGMEMNVEKNKSNENFKTAIPSNNYDRPKTTGECGMF